MINKFRTLFSTWNTNLSTFHRVSSGFVRTSIARYDPVIAMRRNERGTASQVTGFFSGLTSGPHGTARVVPPGLKPGMFLLTLCGGVKPPPASGPSPSEAGEAPLLSSPSAPYLGVTAVPWSAPGKGLTGAMASSRVCTSRKDGSSGKSARNCCTRPRARQVWPLRK
jgi:hypothetical protein